MSHLRIILTRLKILPEELTALSWSGNDVLQVPSGIPCLRAAVFSPNFPVQMISPQDEDADDCSNHI